MTETDEPRTIAELVASLVAANEELSILLRDRDSTQQLGAPAETRVLGSVQRRFAQRGIAIPPSYRDFLTLHNGWKNFSGELSLLSGDAPDDKWVGEIAGLSHDFLGPDDPFKQMIPVALSPGSVARMVFIDTQAVDDDGEAEVVVYEDIEEATRFPSFFAYLESYAACVADVIDCQKNGDPTE